MHRAVPGYPLVARRRRLSLIGPKGSFRVRRPIYTFGHQRSLATKRLTACCLCGHPEHVELGAGPCGSFEVVPPNSGALAPLDK